MDENMMSLSDATGATYAASKSIYTNINPNLPVVGTLVYEVPSGAKGLTLKIQSGIQGDKEGYLIIN